MAASSAKQLLAGADGTCGKKGMLQARKRPYVKCLPYVESATKPGKHRERASPHPTSGFRSLVLTSSPAYLDRARSPGYRLVTFRSLAVLRSREVSRRRIKLGSYAKDFVRGGTDPNHVAPIGRQLTSPLERPTPGRDIRYQIFNIPDLLAVE
jgi:hypothetical protein